MFLLLELYGYFAHHPQGYPKRIRHVNSREEGLIYSTRKKNTNLTTNRNEITRRPGALARAVGGGKGVRAENSEARARIAEEHLVSATVRRGSRLPEVLYPQLLQHRGAETSTCHSSFIRDCLIIEYQVHN